MALPLPPGLSPSVVTCGGGCTEATGCFPVDPPFSPMTVRSPLAHIPGPKAALLKPSYTQD